MNTVTVRPDASPGEKLLAYEQEMLIERPHLSAEYVRHLVRQQHSDLAQLDHAGLMEAPAPSVDPGILINAAVHKRLTDDRAMNEAEAHDQVRKEHPEWVQAWSECRHLPAETVTTRAATGPVRQHSDPGREYMRLVEMEMAEKHVDYDTARNTVRKRDPGLMAAYHTARPIPVGASAVRTTVDSIIADGIASIARMRQDLTEIASMTGPGHDPLNPGQRQHYSSMSAAERARHFPHARPLGRGEALRAGETRVEKMGSADADGGSWAVRECAA